jgi:hypothetical protein
MKPTEILTAVVAAYGAALSTFSVFRQANSERVKILVTCSRDMQLHGDDRYADMTLVVLKAVNIGRRPVTIVGSGAKCLYPAEHFMGRDNRPTMPCEIKEGGSVMTTLDQAGIDFAEIDYWQFWDEAGRSYRLREASRFQHWKSSYRRWRSGRLETRLSQGGGTR